MQVTMTEDAVANYGEEWRGVVLDVIATATKYMPAAEFYARGRPAGYHPGYDSSLKGEPLYDLRIAETGEDVPFSLYRWEVNVA